MPSRFFMPMHYARNRDRYRPPRAAYSRLTRRLGPAATSLRLVPDDVITLEVPGLLSGVIRRVTVVRAGCDGAHYVVSLAGESDWVRNVRAAGGHVVIAGRHRRAARLAEVTSQRRAAVIRAYLLRWGRLIVRVITRSPASPRGLSAPSQLVTAPFDVLAIASLYNPPP